MTSWKFSCSLLVIMMSRKASAKLALLSASRLVVGSSSAKMPQFKQNVSASAKRMMRHASTCTSQRRCIQHISTTTVINAHETICYCTDVQLRPISVARTAAGHALDAQGQHLQVTGVQPNQRLSRKKISTHDRYRSSCQSANVMFFLGPR